jgi:hypothetical protein
LGIEPRGYEHSSFPVSILLKNETTASPFELSLSLELIPEPSFHPSVSVDPLSSSLSGENFPLSNQESISVYKLAIEEESVIEMKLGGNVPSPCTSCWN